MNARLVTICGVAGMFFTTLTASTPKEPGYVSSTGSKIESVYRINAFQPSLTDFNMNHYDANKMIGFLNSISSQYQKNQIVEVDGLKWIKEAEEWMPYPNPPMPVLDPGEDVTQHVKQYAKWIDDHPHFGYPPLPFEKEELVSVTY